MPNNINDALTGYDMVWAVTQNTIKSQLAWLFTMGFITKEVKFGDLDKDGFQFDGVIEQPELILANESSNAIAYFIVRFSSGKIQYYTGFGKAASVAEANLTPDPFNKEETIWKLAFKVNLNISLIAENYQERGSIPKSIKDQLYNLKSSDFTVKSIFLDFQNSDMTTYVDSLSNIPTGNSLLKSNFCQWLGAWIIDKQKSDNPYILGYTAETPSNETSVFEPTGSTFSSHRYQPVKPENAGLSTLNFLLMTNGKTPHSSEGQFNYNLVESNEFSGTGLVAKDLVCSQWIEKTVLPALTMAIGSNSSWQRQGEDAKWVYDYKKPEEKTTWENADSGMVDIHVRYNSQTYATAEIRKSIESKDSTNNPGIYVTGHFYFRADFEERPYDVMTIAWAWKEVKLPWDIKIFMKAAEGGKIHLWSETSKSENVIKEDKHELVKFADIFNMGYNDILKSAEDSYVKMTQYSFDYISSTINRFLQSIQTKTILPAPSILVYKDVSFNDENDLKVHFSYDTPMSK